MSLFNLFLLLLIIIIGLFLLLFKNKLSYIGLELIISIISIPALYFLPVNGEDLFSYFRDLQDLSIYNTFSKVILLSKNDINLQRNKYEYIFNLIEWLISRTNIFNLLPFLIVFIVYSCLFIPYLYQRNHFNIKPHIIIISSLPIVVMFPYSNIVSTLRWWLASAIFFVITYFYCKCKKNNINIIIFSCFYVSLFLIHEAMLLPILIAITCLLLSNKKISHMYVFILMFFLCFLIFKFSTDNLMRFKSYKNSTTIIHLTGINELENYMIILLPFIYSIGCILINCDNKHILSQTYKNMFYLFNLLEIIFLPTLFISQRYSIFVAIIDTVCYLKAQRASNYKIQNRVKLCFYLPCIILGIIFVIGITKMNFSSQILRY